jgi:hypothetical protein
MADSDLNPEEQNPDEPHKPTLGGDDDDDQGGGDDNNGSWEGGGGN